MAAPPAFIPSRLAKVDLLWDSEGITIHIPRPGIIARAIRYRIRSVRNNLVTLCWPVPVWAVCTFLAVGVSFVLYAPPLRERRSRRFAACSRL